jgi:hypothetical protein
MYINSIVSGLTGGTTYWFDLSIISTETYPPTAAFIGNDITCSIFELSGGMGPTGASITIPGVAPTGPTDPNTRVNWGKVNITGTDYWVPLYL